MGDESNKKKKVGSMSIVGINLLVMVVYTIILAAIPDGLVLDIFLLPAHVLVCLIAAIVNRSWIWVLSAMSVLIIGFSTCAGIFSISHTRI